MLIMTTELASIWLEGVKTCSTLLHFNKEHSCPKWKSDLLIVYTRKTGLLFNAYQNK